jgi:putative ABC transport system ATP-binding protein
MSSIISISNLTKVYQRDKQEIRVLNNLSLEIEKGDFVALMGPSGSGKTTLLNIIAGIDKPSSGNIIVADTNIATLSETELAKWRSRHIGFIFQFYNLIPVLTAYENVELPLMLTPLSKSERKNQVELALNVVGLGDRLHHYPKQLSGGQEQRVAIARAIASDPDIFVADEPTGDLDRVSAEEILTLLDRLNKEFGKTIVMVTHDPYAAKKAHTTHHLEKGDLLQEASKL